MTLVCRQERGRITYISGLPNTGKSTVIRFFRAAALHLGKTTRIPHDTQSINLSHVHKSHLTREEAMDSPLMKTRHTDLMPLLEGEVVDRLMEVKGGEPRKVIHSMHHIK